MNRSRYRWILLGLLLVADVARGDEFVLDTGARIRGQWLNRDDRPLNDYIIRTEQGGRLTLAASRVVETVKQHPARIEYERLAPQFADRAAEQWKLSQWCLQQGLSDRRAEHLQRVIELDPDHVGARRALGFSQIGGRWVTRQQTLREQGYVYYRGKWRLAQEVDLLEERRRAELAEKQWLVELTLWRSQLGGEKTHAALQNLSSVRDPAAIHGLAKLLQRDHYRPTRLLYVELLGRIEHDRAVAVLVATAVSDQDEEVFHACLDQIVARKTPGVVKLFAQLLKNPSNTQVNRAASALARLEEPAVIGPLIDALVTTHELSLPGGAPGAMTTGVFRRSDMPGPGTAFAQQHRPSVTTLTVPNHEVLNALVELTGGVSFGFDQQAWRNWHAVQRNRQPATAQLRTGD